MTAKNNDPKSSADETKASDTGPSAAGADSHPPVKALPKPTGRAGSGQVDVTGIMPEGIRIDPDLTEGHPGYEESGESEIIPTERLSGGEATQGEDSAH